MKRHHLEVAFHLSGEHPLLPKAEVRAVLEASGTGFKTKLDLDSLLILEIDELPNRLMDYLASRLAYTRSIGRVLAVLDAREFPKALFDREPPRLRGRFRATAVRVRGCCRNFRRMEVERLVGSWILRGNPQSRVDLSDFSSEVVIIMTSGYFVIFLREREVDRTLFKIKEVAARPFVHPASMRPTLARAMVNLARTREGDIVLDPFLGVGGIALEVLSVGARFIGSDINENLVIDAKNNLIAYGFLEGFELLVGNALNLELKEKVDRIVTDPPYGRMSVAVGNTPEDLSRKFVAKAPDYLKKEGWIAISVPKDHLVASDFTEAGFEVVERFDVREHRSLTRRVWVARLK